MDKDTLMNFIAEAHKNTYAAPKEIKDKHRCNPIQEGHKDYEFIDGDWRYHDSYAGSTQAPGREVIFFKDKPVWSMSYQGQTIDGLSEDFIKKTFEFLKEALRNFVNNMPFRGPAIFRQGDFEYNFSIEGNLNYFTGKESIKYNGKEVFFQHVIGTLIK